MLISIHAPREGGDHIYPSLTCRNIGISIHAPREGGDGANQVVRQLTKISIHAPREGGDCASREPIGVTTDFNPRPPRGGRRYVYAIFVVL